MFARTPRLTLRPGWAEDAPALAAAIAHESVVSKLERVPWPYTLDDAVGFLARSPAPGEATCLILAHESERPRLIGVVGIHAQERGHVLGYWLTPDAWSHGYATEAGRAMLGIARHGLGLRRLESRHFIDNPASGHVLRKLGFRPTGQILRLGSRARSAPCYARDLTDDEGPAMSRAA